MAEIYVIIILNLNVGDTSAALINHIIVEKHVFGDSKPCASGKEIVPQ